MQVCVVHPKASLQPRNKPSMYTPNHNPGGEEYGQYARLGYNADSTGKYGMVPSVQKRLGQVWQPWYETMLQQAGLQGTAQQGAVATVMGQPCIPSVMSMPRRAPVSSKCLRNRRSTRR